MDILRKYESTAVISVAGHEAVIDRDSQVASVSKESSLPMQALSLMPGESP